MDKPLLKTKLYIPSLRPKFVSRPRLLERLETGLKLKLTLVAAPAGYGKTTLLSEAVRSSRMPVAWLTLDEGDNDPVFFWSYVISAMQAVQVDIGKSAQGLLQLPQAPPIESILTNLINDMSEVDKEFALVLDDYHIIEAQPVHEALVFLLNQLPPRAHLVIASRTDPPIPLAHMRAQNQLVEVRSTDLRFNFEESTAFLNDIMSLRLSDEDVAALESRTEGWIASLQLAAVSMQGRDDVAAFIAGFSGSNRYIMDYLIEEVLGRQEEGIQSFLLVTSILDRFTASLCNAVTGRDDGGEMLAKLEATNLFLVPLDDERHWYRYHHLFADLLSSQSLQSQKERMPEFYIRASEWFEREGLINEAISHALGAKDFERAANLVESVALTMIYRSNCLTVLGWLEKLPGALIDNHPWLCLSGALANQLTGHQDAVEPLLQRAESAMSKAEQEQPDASFPDHAGIRSRVATVRVTSSLYEGRAPHTIELCHEALKHLPEDDLITRAVVTENLGAAYWITGDLPAAQLYLEEAKTLGQTSGHLYYSIFAMSYLGEIHWVQGHLHEAAQQYRKALELGSRGGGDEPLPATGTAHVGLSQVLYEWNDINEAIHHTNIGAKLAERGGVIKTLLMGWVFLAWQNQARGNTEAVMEAIQRAEGISPESVNPYTLRQASAWKARLSLSQGDLNAANHWAASREPKVNLQDIPDFWSELPYLTLVRLRITQGEVDDIPELLERLRTKVEAEKRTGSLIEILALQSIALQAKGEVDKALTTLEHALSLAEPEWYVRTFIDEGVPMAQLLHKATALGIMPEYTGKLLAAFKAEQPRYLKESHLPPQPLVEPLSQRELEVLQLAAMGLSNHEISQRLLLALSTVKGHNRNIFSKLGVKNRTEAVHKARALEILPPQ